jgi:hypothetical protein
MKGDSIVESMTREQILADLQRSFEGYLNEYGADSIGTYEEPGQGGRYYFGCTVKKDDRTFHIHTPFAQQEDGSFTALGNGWTAETDDPKLQDKRGYGDLESALKEI